jgi:hypothetical protein
MQIWAASAMRQAEALREAERQRQAEAARRERERQIAQAADTNFQGAVRDGAASLAFEQAVRDTRPADNVVLGGPNNDILGIYEKTFADMQELLGTDPAKLNTDHELPPGYMPELMKATLDLAKLRDQPDGAAAQIKRYEQFFEAVQKLPVGAHHHHPIPGPAGAAVALGVDAATRASVPRPLVHSHDGGRPHKHDDHDHPHPHPHEEVEIEVVGAKGTHRHA